MILNQINLSIRKTFFKFFILIITFLFVIPSCKTFRISKKKSPTEIVQQDTTVTDTTKIAQNLIFNSDSTENRNNITNENITIDSLLALENKKIQDSISLFDTIPVKQPLRDTFSIIGVGDIMLGTNFPSPKYLPLRNDCKPLLNDVDSILQSADVTFGNLEGAFSDDAPVVKRCQDPEKCYAFRTPEKYFNCLIESGFDLFSMANNHMNDLGYAGKKNTIKLINQAGLDYAGLIEKTYAIVERDSLKIGLCAFAPNSGTCQLNHYKEVERIVRQADSLCDVLIVSFHGGAEGNKHQRVTRKTEQFYGENRGNVYEFAHFVIDAGADIVFGHGPHVVRAVELYKDRFIAYSLGNFCTYSRMNLLPPNNLAPIVKVLVNRKGEFLEGQIISAIQIKGKGTFLDKKEKAFLKIKELTLLDFPENKIHFDKNGIIRKKTTIVEP